MAFEAHDIINQSRIKGFMNYLFTIISQFIDAVFSFTAAIFIQP